MQFIRENEELMREGLRRRNAAAGLDELLALDCRRRELLQEAESLRAERNRVSREISRMGEKPSDLVAQMRGVGERIKALEAEVAQVDIELGDLLLRLPNLPHESVPTGTDESYNVVVRKGGERMEPGFEAKPHWELAERLGLADFARGSKLSGARFYVLKGLGARLERALINWMLDLHVREHDYTEVATPYLVRRECMVGTGQLPKFEEEMYRCDLDDLFLIPTAEVPVTNLHREEILEPGTLPLNYVSYSACFRREAGAAGKDTRGFTRVHQFNKVELVKLVEPEHSYKELEKLVRDAEAVLQGLGLPYRVVLLCSGDLGFASAKTYDLEVWHPGQGKYIEVSSCSNFADFQARRAGIRYRPAPGEKAELVHTLNGSGLAVGRSLAAVLENYQRADGSVTVPQVLRPFLGGLEVIR